MIFTSFFSILLIWIQIIIPLRKLSLFLIGFFYSLYLLFRLLMIFKNSINFIHIKFLINIIISIIYIILDLLIRLMIANNFFKIDIIIIINIKNIIKRRICDLMFFNIKYIFFIWAPILYFLRIYIFLFFNTIRINKMLNFFKEFRSISL